MGKLSWDVRSAPSSDGAVVVAVRGDLSETNRAELVASLAELLGEHHQVVLDISRLRAHDASAVQAFAEAHGRAGGWPRACLALAAPEPALVTLLTDSGVADEAPVYAEVGEALTRCADRPSLLREGWRFEVDAHAPGRARSRVRAVCRRWGLGGEVRQAAEIVVTELVTNAVEHAASPSMVEVSQRGDAIRMTVRDYGTGAAHRVPEAAAWRAPPTSSPRGRGLAMVAAVSRAWGVLVHADGKTIWAEMAA